MAFLDELSRKFTETIKRVGEKSEELVGLGKLNYEIYREEDNIRKLYGKIGEAVYEAYSKENSSINAIYNLCRQIDDRRERIEELKRQVEEIKAGGAKAETTAEPQSENVENAEKQSEDPAQTSPKQTSEEEGNSQPVSEDKKFQES